MAQTRKRRSTKHRGNAAGGIETRGRTGRKPTDKERAGGVRDQARSRRMDRLDRKPTVRGSINRAAIAALLFFFAVVFLFKEKLLAAAVLALVLVLVYIPMTYYTDLALYRRRQRQKAQGKA
jgi:Flp pilus assembly protein TadB